MESLIVPRRYLRNCVLGALAGAILGFGCATDAAPSETQLPLLTGEFVGSYRVPTRPSLADAALYPVEHVDWNVTAGIATLHYSLPVGLVGGKLEVTLSGMMAPGATTIDLSSAVGSGACVAAGPTITCREQFSDLGVLPISMPVVEQVAALQYAGPVAHRIEVATIFSSDPIGIVEFDLRSPVVDDHGGGSGSGSGGGGHGGGNAD